MLSLIPSFLWVGGAGARDDIMLLSFSLPYRCFAQSCKINKNMICQSKLRASLVPTIIRGTRLLKKQFFLFSFMLAAGYIV